MCQMLLQTITTQKSYSSWKGPKLHGYNLRYLGHDVEGCTKVLETPKDLLRQKSPRFSTQNTTATLLLLTHTYTPRSK